jgi:Ca2+-binding RTX toxin-like protein
VRSSISFSLVNSAHVLGVLERLTLLGSPNINGTGNALGNSLIGNAGINTLNGGDGSDSLFGVAGNDVLLGGAGNDGLVGGLGNDTMSGGAGSDSFVFDAPLGNIDRITDFNVAADTIRLDNAVFTAITGTGVLTAAQFARNTTGLAQDASDRIVYETDTGRVFYDSNGNAAGGSIQFAVLATNLGIINPDFVVI